MYKFLCAFHSGVLIPMKAHWFPLHGWRTAGVVSWREGFRLYNHQQVLQIQNACNISTGNWPCILCNCLSLMESTGSHYCTYQIAVTSQLCKLPEYCFVLWPITQQKNLPSTKSLSNMVGGTCFILITESVLDHLGRGLPFALSAIGCCMSSLVIPMKKVLWPPIWGVFWGRILLSSVSFGLHFGSSAYPLVAIISTEVLYLLHFL